MTNIGLEIAKTIVDSLDEKKGEDILLLDLVGICSFTDYFVICTGSSERMLKALAEDVKAKVKMVHMDVKQRVEGESASGWVLIDYGDVVVHLFSQSLRKYFQLEELWREGNVLLRVQ
jgi:ribosome-associated protein